ncbi:MAG: hypothetical protein AB8C84_11280 [Oligoflexales bacterium]
MEHDKRSLIKDIEGLATLVDKRSESETGIRPFSGQFPKMCRCCNTVFHNLKEYIDQTNPINYRLYQVAPGKAFDFRNCQCGSSLVVSYCMERDQTEIGDTQRAVFNDCLKQIDANDDDLVDGLRVIFRYVLLMGPGYLATEEFRDLYRKVLDGNYSHKVDLQTHGQNS